MIPWNPEATAQDHLAAARCWLPCDCGGSGWVFGGGYGLVACADCNDQSQKPKPESLSGGKPPTLSRAPECWRQSASGPAEYACAQCGATAFLLHWLSCGWWWTCLCLAAAETARGVVVLKFPQPLGGRLPMRIG